MPSFTTHDDDRSTSPVLLPSAIMTAPCLPSSSRSSWSSFTHSTMLAKLFTLSDRRIFPDCCCRDCSNFCSTSVKNACPSVADVGAATGMANSPPPCLISTVEASLLPQGWQRGTLPPPPPPGLGGGGESGTARTATIFKSSLFKDGSDASAVPITFRSAQSDPVGILTSIFVPLYNMGFPTPPLTSYCFSTSNTAKTGFFVLRNQNCLISFLLTPPPSILNPSSSSSFSASKK
mmetsp:Transcript_28460/g.41381  ORF Transcript_28460/g.41381 Transcript_28460/m.41381 type:complete len:234 (+) Transcript_28460:632-1333(+)